MGDATRKGVEQLTRKSLSIRFSLALPILLIVCDSCECPSRSDGPPVGWPCSERIACRGVRRSVDAGANTYTPIYALCADAGTLLHPCINRPLHPFSLETSTPLCTVPDFMLYYPCLEAEPGDLTASRNAYTTVEPLDETRRWAELTRRVMPLDLLEPRRRRPVRERLFQAGRSVAGFLLKCLYEASPNCPASF